MFFRKRKSVDNDNYPEPTAATVIGADTTLDGNIETAGELRIEGSIRGSVRAGICVVDAGGNIEGEVAAGEIIIFGQVIGPVQATHVHLQNGAWVQGDITSDTIAIETGARLTGAVWQNSREPGAKQRAAPSFGELPSPFEGSLWSNGESHDLRPLLAVKPRAANGSAR